MAGRPPPMSSPLMLSTAAPPDSSHARDGGSLTQPFGHVAAGRKATKADWARPHANSDCVALRRQRHPSAWRSKRHEQVWLGRPQWHVAPTPR